MKGTSKWGRALALVLIGALLVLIISGPYQAPARTSANSGGKSDSTLEYNCGGSCHNVVGTGTVIMASSDLAPNTDQTITVTVSVTEPLLSSMNLIGVFLTRSLSTTNSMPSVDGWTILSDPNGGTHNYAQKTSAAETMTDFTWTLRVPSQVGTYKLYARVHLGPGALFEDYKAGLSFQVAALPLGMPVIDHMPVSTSSTNEDIVIEAKIKDATSASLYWKVENDTDFHKVEMTKASQSSDGESTYMGTISALEEPTEIDYFINATNGNLYSVTPESRIQVTVKVEPPNLMAWGMQNFIILEGIILAGFLFVRLSIKSTKIDDKKGNRRRN